MTPRPSFGPIPSFTPIAAPPPQKPLSDQYYEGAMFSFQEGNVVVGLLGLANAGAYKAREYPVTAAAILGVGVLLLVRR